MADISGYISDIQNARFGSEVRDSICNAFDVVSRESEEIRRIATDINDKAASLSRNAENLSGTSQLLEERQDDLEILYDAVTSVLNPKFIFGGEDMGATVRDPVWTALNDGEFWLYGVNIGNFWTINGRRYTIADFDYWYGTSSQNTYIDKHHIVLIGDPIRYDEKTICAVQGSLPSGSTAQAYYYSKLREYIRNVITPEVEQAFGAEHLLTHNISYSFGTDSTGRPVTYSAVDETVSVLSERMVFGHPVNSVKNGLYVGYEYNQLAIFYLARKFLLELASKTSNGFWLSDTFNETQYTKIDRYGRPSADIVTSPRGVVPVFAICAA